MINKVLFLSFTICLFFSFTVFSQVKTFIPEEGDLLFQDLDCGVFCDAIEKVTIGYKGAKFSHVALAAKNEKGEMVVIEAVSKGVSVTPLDLFLAKSHDKNMNPKVVVGRLKPKYRHLIPQAIQQAYKLVGRPYDDVFCITNNSYYCSELIYEAFKIANNGKPIFPLYPMTFKDPDTKQFFPAWLQYYKDLNAKIPEGELGNGPGSISKSKKLKIVYAYGIPNGW
jgi:hypothetical protein